MRSQSPRGAEWLLRRFLPDEDAEAIAGDLEEMLRARLAAGSTRRAARRWYWRQTVSVVSAHLHPGFEPAEQPQRKAMPAFRQDLAGAFRSLRKQPAFAMMAISMLALGTGANVAIFSLVNAVLLKPLPFAEPDRLMLAHLLVPERDSPGTLAPTVWSYPKYRVFRDNQRVFDGTAMFTSREWNVTGTGMPERITIELVESSYFEVLRTPPQLGRTFSADETRAPGSAPFAVLGHAFWMRRFGADASIIGRTIGLNGVSHTVLGIMPPGFRGLSGQTQIWAPVMMLPKDDLEEPWSHSYSVVARRAPGVEVGQAVAAVRLLGESIADEFKDPFESGSRWGATAVPLNDERTDPLVRRSMWLLLAAVAGVLLIVCVNLANLTLARALARQREVAIRLALGANRVRIVRQLMTESLVLACLGTGAGLAVAYVALSAGARLMPDLATVVERSQSAELTRVGLGALGADSATLLFAATVAVLSTVLFGLGPAWSASRRDLSSTIKAGASGSIAHGSRGLSLRNMLLVAEMALALVLLTAGGLMLKSVVRLQATELGFKPESLLTFRLMLPAPQYERQRATQLIDSLLGRLARQPGFESVAYGSCPPVSGGCNMTMARFPDRPPLPRGSEPLVGVMWASPGYFDTLGIRLMRGRVFNERDRAGAQKVVVINETAARALWPGEDPIGKRIGVGQGGFNDGAEVVGIVADVRYRAVETAITADVYLPLLQSPRSQGMMYVRSRSSAAVLGPIVRREVAALDPDLPLTDLRTMEQRFGDAIWRTRMSAWLLGVFSCLALLVAALGIYSVMSEGVVQRTREIGVRMALGANRTDILRLIIGRVVVVALIGVAIGLALALPTMRMLSALLYQVKPGDPVVFGALALILLGVAVGAGYLPARRAARVDPLVTLRAE
jgi:putative ABC transport system permease protein